MKQFDSLFRLSKLILNVPRANETQYLSHDVYIDCISGDATDYNCH